MKILFHFRTRGTGAEAVHISGVANGFERFGHRVIFSSPTGVDPRSGAGTDPYAPKPHLIPKFVFEILEIAYNLFAWARNRRILLKERCGMIYERHAFFLCATAWLAKRFGLPLVVEVNELVGDPRVRGQPVFRRLVELADRIVFRNAALVVAVSPYLGRRIEQYGVPKERVMVLPNGVAEAAVAAMPDGRPVRDRWGCAGEKVIAFVGWFTGWHRIDLLLEAFAMIEPGRLGTRLMLVGDGELHDQLRAQAVRLGILDRVIFAGIVPHGEVAAHIAAADICVVPHSNEYRSPIKLFEYMGQGKAVVAPGTEPIRMVIGHGRNGLLFEPGSAKGMAECFVRFLDDAALRQTAGETARADVLAEHTWETNARKVLDAVGIAPVTR